MRLSFLRSSSALNQSSFNQDLLDVLLHGDLANEQAARHALTPPANDSVEDDTQADDVWDKIKAGQETLTFDQITKILQEFEKQNLNITPDTMAVDQPDSPFAQQAFYDALRDNDDIIGQFRQELENLRDESKKQRGFLSRAFNVFASEKPLETILNDATSFQDYCTEQGILFDDIEATLKQGDKPPGIMDKITDFRFLLAAVGGIATGLIANASGVNLASFVPMGSAIPGFFFGALPYIAVPFIALNIFKAFSEKSILKEAGTFGRFVATMALGITIGLGTTFAMSGLLPKLDTEPAVATAELDPSTTKLNATPLTQETKAEPEAAPESLERPFTPSQYILHSIALFTVFATLYRLANEYERKKKLGEPLTEQESAAGKFIEKLSKLVINDKTNPGIIAAGDVADKAAGVTDTAFNKYLDWVGLPAIFLMMNETIAKGGLAQLSAYAPYYATVTASMGVCALALAGIGYGVYHFRKKEFTEVAKTASTAFSISSSAATMPVTKQSLKNIGLSDKTINSVVPLGANFNMMGTALYLGVTASCAITMLGYEPTAFERLIAMGTVILTAFGAPGAPGSTVIFLDPVLARLGMTPLEAQKIYEMVLPADRLFDMAQTSLNVTGDMMVAADTERWGKDEETQIAPARIAISSTGEVAVFPELPIVAEEKDADTPETIQPPPTNTDPQPPAPGP